MSQSPATRHFAVGVTLFIALAAAALSYDHAFIVAKLVGTGPRMALLVPLLPDGLIVLAFASMHDAAQMKAPRPGWATLGLGLGVAVTVVLNVASGWHHGWGGRALNALPPVALLVAIEVLVGILRRGRDLSHYEDHVTSGAQAEPAEAPPVQVALARLTADYSQRELAAVLNVSRAHVQRHWPRPDQVASNGSARNEAGSFSPAARSKDEPAETFNAEAAGAAKTAPVSASLNGSGPDA